MKVYIYIKYIEKKIERVAIYNQEAKEKKNRRQ